MLYFSNFLGVLSILYTDAPDLQRSTHSKPYQIPHYNDSQNTQQTYSLNKYNIPVKFSTT